MQDNTKRHIIIGICTCNRPMQLAACLTSLAGQKLPDSLRAHIHCEILVVDNAPGAAVATIVHERNAASPYPISLVNQPVRGISEARNTAVSYALSSHCHALLFLDDDEEAAPGWLEHILATWIRLNADIVAGPVIYPASPEVPEWFEQVAVFRPRHMRTGRKVTSVYTHNALIGSRVLRAMEPLFDTRFSFTGGEDTHFSHRLRQYPFTAYWCNEAVVKEYIAPERASLSWIMRRGFRTGTCWVESVRITCGLRRLHAYLFFVSSFLACQSLRMLARMIAAFATCSRPTLYSAYYYGAQALGVIMGMAGIRYEEYRVRNTEPKAVPEGARSCSL